MKLLRRISLACARTLSCFFWGSIGLCPLLRCHSKFISVECTVHIASMLICLLSLVRVAACEMTVRCHEHHLASSHMQQRRTGLRRVCILDKLVYELLVYLLIHAVMDCVWTAVLILSYNDDDDDDHIIISRRTRSPGRQSTRHRVSSCAA